MARSALSRLQGWLWPLFHLPPVFSHLLHIPWEGNREAGPWQALIAFHSAGLCLLLPTGARLNGDGVQGRRETELLSSGGGNETNKQKKNQPQNQHMNGQTQTSRNLRFIPNDYNGIQVDLEKKFTFDEGLHSTVYCWKSEIKFAKQKALQTTGCTEYWKSLLKICCCRN